MFNISFSEIVVISLVALLVLGPERLPRVMRTVGFLWGRVVSGFNRLRFDLSQEMHQYDLKRMQDDGSVAPKDTSRCAEDD
ncbi:MULTISPECIES: Sec-independent protein translocase subunit TatA/TatB [Candidatus Ichthyocystis]|uniref:Sec-independent protein translocase subunit TatA/TatB n=1 Tax=Candidatus Ichthyocystis TaxID=2929841 RepID=UPI000B83AB3F|nr:MULTISPECIES: twin-arginine translocase TatA/TatE family subunit [Ichthyocystis]